MLTGQAKEDFEKWYYEKYNSLPDDIGYWLFEDQAGCYSLFFGYTIATTAAIQKANEIYNQK